MIFYVTFGQKSPFRNGWVEVDAPDIGKAREWTFQALGQQWSMMYTGDKFDRSFFPAGKIGETIK